MVADRTLDSGRAARAARVRNRVRAIAGAALLCAAALGVPGVLPARAAGPVAPLEVAAAEVASARLGSIVVSAHHQVDGREVALAGDTYSLALVATGSVEGSIAKFSTVKEFEEYACDWSSLDAAGLRSKAKKMDAFVRKSGLFTAGDAVTDGDGTALFESVRCGVYLLARTASAPGNERVLIDPVLVLVPYGVDGDLFFGVEVTPKSEDPSKPIDPGDPDVPVDPDVPDKPVDPENPDGPNDPDGPDDPDKPDNPLDEWLEENGLPQTGDVQFQVAAVLLVAGVTMLVTSGLLKRHGAQSADDSDAPEGAEAEEGQDDPDGSDGSDGSEDPDGSEASAEPGASEAPEDGDAPEAERS